MLAITLSISVRDWHLPEKHFHYGAVYFEMQNGVVVSCKLTFEPVHRFVWL